MNQMAWIQRSFFDDQPQEVLLAGRYPKPLEAPRNLSGGRAARDLAAAGANAADEHAKASAAPDWSIKAHAFMVEFGRNHNTFSCWVVRAASVGVVPEPPDARAWGAVFARAARCESPVIEPVGVGRREASRHAGYCTLWRLR